MLKKIMPVPAVIGVIGFVGFVGFAAHAEEDRSILEIYRAHGGMTSPNSASLSSESAPELTVVDPLNTGHEMSPAKIEGFNAAIDQIFTMTPEMIKRYRMIEKDHEQAIQEHPEPEEKTSVNLVLLEPGEPAPRIRVAPLIASVIGFYDITGTPWPVVQYLLGDNTKFQASHLGENSHNIVLTAGSRIGFTNLVVVLEGHDTPAVIWVRIGEEIADSRFDIQVMHPGPAAQINTATGLTDSVSEAGDSLLLAAITGVDLPPDAKSVDVVGVDARAWLVGEHLYLRSSNALLTPGWTGAMTGPDGMRVYRIDPAHTALFSVNGQYVRADIKLP